MERALGKMQNQGKKKMTKINFLQTGESFITEDVTSRGQTSEMATLQGCIHTKCAMSVLPKASGIIAPESGRV